MNLTKGEKFNYYKLMLSRCKFGGRKMSPFNPKHTPFKIGGQEVNLKQIRANEKYQKLSMK